MNCPRINQSCHNHELTIFDNNFFKNIFNFYDDDSLTRFNTFFIKIYDLLKIKCLYCAINNTINVTNKMACKELFPIEVTKLYEISTIFSKFNDNYHFGAINCLFNEILKIQTLFKITELKELKKLANCWKRETRLGDVGERDLSLLLLALILSNTQINPVIIVTDDFPFYNFIIYCYNNGKIKLNNTIFNTRKVCSISAVLYLFNLSNCCCFNEFNEFFSHMVDELLKFKEGKKKELKKDYFLEMAKLLQKSRNHKIELGCEVI